LNYFRRRFGTLKKISKFKRMDLLLKSWRGRGERGEGIDHYMLPPPPCPLSNLSSCQNICQYEFILNDGERLASQYNKITLTSPLRQTGDPVQG